MHRQHVLSTFIFLYIVYLQAKQICFSWVFSFPLSVLLPASGSCSVMENNIWNCSRMLPVKFQGKQKQWRGGSRRLLEGHYFCHFLYSLSTLFFLLLMLSFFFFLILVVLFLNATNSSLTRWWKTIISLLCRLWHTVPSAQHVMGVCAMTAPMQIMISPAASCGGTFS